MVPLMWVIVVSKYDQLPRLKLYYWILINSALSIILKQEAKTSYIPEIHEKADLRETFV